MTKYEISKTHGGYYRVYKIQGKWAVPFSDREFLNRKDAVEWLKRRRK